LPQAEARLLAASLKRWAERPIRRANLRAVGISAAALASYRDPRRLSAMDLAVMWLAVAIAAPLFGN
jgi:hypothetical protein